MLENITTTLTEPLTLPAIKQHLRIEHNEDDDYLMMVATSAREQAEAYIEGPLPVQTFKLTLDSFPVAIMLEKTPVIAVTEIAYTDTDGNPQTWTDFDLIKTDFKAEIRPLTGECFPSTEDGRNKVEVTFTAGYAVVPESAIHALKLISGTLYEQREDHTSATVNVIAWSSQSLLNSIKKVVI